MKDDLLTALGIRAMINENIKVWSMEDGTAFLGFPHGLAESLQTIQLVPDILGYSPKGTYRTF